MKYRERWKFIGNIWVLSLLQGKTNCTVDYETLLVPRTAEGDKNCHSCSFRRWQGVRWYSEPPKRKHLLNFRRGTKYWISICYTVADTPFKVRICHGFLMITWTICTKKSCDDHVTGLFSCLWLISQLARLHRMDMPLRKYRNLNKR